MQLFKPFPITAAAALLLVGAGCVTTGAGQSAVIRAKEKVAPALVHIRPVKEVYTQGAREERVSIGSGFIISPDGYIVTNEHVSGEAKVVSVVLSDKEEVEAEVVGVDAYTDIAVLKVEAPTPLPHVTLGSSDTLTAGQTVLALGSPHGLARSVSQGIISVTDRHLESRGTMVSPFNTWLQTDAAINPGNSGGPLVNLRGEVVGVNTRVLSGAENVGFAVPIDAAKPVIAALREEGRVRRGTIGVQFQEMLARTDDATRQGVIIADVDPLSPANDAGLRPGDVLTAINGAPVNARFEEDLPAVRRMVAGLPVDAPAMLSVQRAGELREVELTPEPLGGLKGTENAFEEWAFTASDMTPAQVRRARLDQRRGVYVSGAQVGGLAAQAGLQQGDVVLRVDDEEVADLDSFKTLYEERVATGKSQVMLFVKRGAISRFVLLEQDPALAVSVQPAAEAEETLDEAPALPAPETVPAPEEGDPVNAD